MAEENSKTPGRSSTVPKLQKWYAQHRKRRCIQGFSYFLSEFVLVDWDDNSVFKRQFFSSCQGRRENLAFDSGPATLASSENKNQELAVLAASPQPNHLFFPLAIDPDDYGNRQAWSEPSPLPGENLGPRQDTQRTSLCSVTKTWTAWAYEYLVIAHDGKFSAPLACRFFWWQNWPAMG